MSWLVLLAQVVGGFDQLLQGDGSVDIIKKVRRSGHPSLAAAQGV
jgi:hypothetical protein